MEYRIVIGAILFLLVLTPFVSAKISEADRAALQAQLEKYKNDPVKLTLILAVADSTMDLSDEGELRQQVVNTAGAAGLDMSQFPNIAQGTVPYVVQQKQIEEAQVAAEPLQEGTAESGGAPGAGAPGQGGVQPGQAQQAVQPPSPVEQVQPVTSSWYSTGLIVTLLAIAAILVLVGWLYSKRKKQ